MLNYVNHGPRWYQQKPVLPARRKNWEFQAVLSGRIGILTPEGPDILRQRTLWLFPPDHPHGWTGEKGRQAEIAVFHFPSIPEPLRRLARGGVLQAPLNHPDCLRIRTLARSCQGYIQIPNAGTVMACEHALMELSLLMFERLKPGGKTGDSQSADERVNRALTWYELHLSDNPGLEQVSRAVATSPAQLRRLFHAVLQASPKEIFDQMRFSRATHLMFDPSIKLSEVSEACGFGSPSAFSRAFKHKFGCSPDQWRG